MGRIMTVTMIGMLFCIMLAACQPTPNEEIIVNKNDGSLDQKIQEEVEEQQDVNENNSETWKEQITTRSGVTLNINAQVVVPETGKYPVVKVKPIAFSEEQIYQAAEYLSNGATM